MAIHSLSQRVQPSNTLPCEVVILLCGEIFGNPQLSEMVKKRLYGQEGTVALNIDQIQTHK